MKRIFGNITGQACWKALHRDQTGPCPSCTSSRLLTPSGEPAGPIVSEIFRPLAGYRVERRDRAIRWLDGRIVRIQVATNITARKHAEEALKKAHDELELRVRERTAELRESEKKYKDIFEEAVVAIYQTTPKGRFRMVNPYFARLHGYESPEECVRSIADIATQVYVEPERRKDFLALMEKDGIARNVELKVRTREGAIKHVTLNAHAVKDANGRAAPCRKAQEERP